MHGGYASAMATGNCDLMVVVGARFSDRVAGDAKTFAKDAKIIHIDIDAAEFDKNVMVDLTIRGSADAVLSKLARNVDSAQHPDWVNQIAEWSSQKKCSQQDGDNVTPENIFDELNKIGAGDTIPIKPINDLKNRYLKLPFFHLKLCLFFIRMTVAKTSATAFRKKLFS